MTDILRQQTIHLNPTEVKDDHLSALNELINDNTDTDIDIEQISTFVLDSDPTGLDSHATILYNEGGNEGDEE